MTITAFITTQLFSQFIKDQGYNRSKKLLFPKKTYITRLNELINETIDEYEKKHPYDKRDRQYPFYHSQAVFDVLCQYVLNKRCDISGLNEQFLKHPEIIVPSSEQLTSFFETFTNKAKNDEKLRELYFRENFREEIFEISKTLTRIVDDLASLKTGLPTTVTADELFAAFNAQVKSQIRKQIKSGKYIPDTFVETNDFKDHSRYFVAPFFFYPKLLEEIEMLDFRHLNRIRAMNNGPLFNLDINNFSSNLRASSLAELPNVLRKMKDYIRVKKQEIDPNTNLSHGFYRKLEEKIEALPFLSSKMLIIEEAAGQGKTNFLCDLAQNVLLKRNIPSIFLTGYDVDPINIKGSIVKRINSSLPELTLNNILGIIKDALNNSNNLFIILIDGLNENSNPRDFSKNLELFISEMFQYDFVRIILTCRTEYFKHNFTNLLKTTDGECIAAVDTLNRQLDEAQKERLYNTYLRHFSVEIGSILPKVYEQLVDNFLLLRIFSEVYSGVRLPSIRHIFREELFGRYYEVKCAEINKALMNNDAFKLRSNFDIRNFMKQMVSYMLDHSQFSDIPLDEVLKNDPSCSDVFARFLDENIIVRKDLKINALNPFENKEVVNFTFDEFRDYLLSSYMISIYKNSRSTFEKFINENLTENSPILEGCSTFLFSLERKLKDGGLTSLIKAQSWYKKVFKKAIFNIVDSDVTEDDKLLILKMFETEVGFSRDLIIELCYLRFEVDLYPNLNIVFLFKILNGLPDEEMEKHVYSIYRRSYNARMLENLISSLDEILLESDFEKKPAFHNIFEFALYLIPLSRRVRELYERYWRRYQNVNHFKNILESKSIGLRRAVEEFIRGHEISL